RGAFDDFDFLRLRADLQGDFQVGDLACLHGDAIEDLRLEAGLRGGELISAEGEVDEAVGAARLRNGVANVVSREVLKLQLSAPNGAAALIQDDYRDRAGRASLRPCGRHVHAQEQ